ncbi:carboxymuconolactone decarboxylase family protein [Pseudonocardia sp. CA-142604]|uniref:carboxymuconolactone decarboxylase family protein n=1 Tax=Pseudonocardia sp. CA-142604 TaxID=3240024 RepID=UPI003D92D458
MSRIPLPVDQDIPEASWPVLKAIEKQLGFIPNMHRALSLSPAVLNGVSGLGTALSRTLDAITKHGIAHAVTEVNGCSYCKAIHTFTATNFGRIPAEEIELFQQGRASDPKRSAAVAFAKKVIETHGKVSDADLDAVRKVGYKDSQILEIVALTVQFSMTNFLNNVMDTDIDIPEPSAT